MELEAHNKVSLNCPQRHGREAHTNTSAYLKPDIVAAAVLCPLGKTSQDKASTTNC